MENSTPDSAEKDSRNVLEYFWPVQMSLTDQRRLAELRDKADPENKGKQLSSKRNEAAELDRLEELAGRIPMNRRRLIALSVATTIGGAVAIHLIKKATSFSEAEWHALENPEIPWTIKQTPFESPEVTPEQTERLQNYINQATTILRAHLNRERAIGFFTADPDDPDAIKAEIERRTELQKTNEARLAEIEKLFLEIEAYLKTLGDRVTPRVGRVLNMNGEMDLSVPVHLQNFTLQLGELSIPVRNSRFISTPGTEAYNSGMYEGHTGSVNLNSIFHTFDPQEERFETDTPQALPNEIASHIYRQHVTIDEESMEGREGAELFSDYFTTFFLPVAGSADFLLGRLLYIQSGETPATYHLIERCLLLALKQSKDFGQELRQHGEAGIVKRIQDRDERVTRAFLEFQQNFRAAAEDYIPEAVLEDSKRYIPNSK